MVLEVNIDKLFKEKLGIKGAELELLKVIYRHKYFISIESLTKLMKKDRSTIQRNIFILNYSGYLETKKQSLETRGYRYIFRFNKTRFEEIKKEIISDLNKELKYIINEIKKW